MKHIIVHPNIAVVIRISGMNKQRMEEEHITSWEPISTYSGILHLRVGKMTATSHQQTTIIFKRQQTENGLLRVAFRLISMRDLNVLIKFFTVEQALHNSKSGPELRLLVPTISLAVAFAIISLRFKNSCCLSLRKSLICFAYSLVIICCRESDWFSFFSLNGYALSDPTNLVFMSAMLIAATSSLEMAPDLSMKTLDQ